MNKILKYIFILILTIGAIMYFTYCLGTTRDFSEIFVDVASGIGLLLAGLGGLIAFADWTKKQGIANNFKKFKDAYTRDKLKKEDGEQGFRLLRNPANGHISIYDLVTKKKHWIKKMSTYYELGYIDNEQTKDWQNIADIGETERSKYSAFEPGDEVIAP